MKDEVGWYERRKREEVKEGERREDAPTAR